MKKWTLGLSLFLLILPLCAQFTPNFLCSLPNDDTVTPYCGIQPFKFVGDSQYHIMSYFFNSDDFNLWLQVQRRDWTGTLIQSDSLFLTLCEGLDSPEMCCAQAFNVRGVDYLFVVSPAHDSGNCIRVSQYRLSDMQLVVTQAIALELVDLSEPSCALQFHIYDSVNPVLLVDAYANEATNGFIEVQRSKSHLFRCGFAGQQLTTPVEMPFGGRQTTIDPASGRIYSFFDDSMTLMTFDPDSINTVYTQKIYTYASPTDDPLCIRSENCTGAWDLTNDIHLFIGAMLMNVDMATTTQGVPAMYMHFQKFTSATTYENRLARYSPDDNVWDYDIESGNDYYYDSYVLTDTDGRDYLLASHQIWQFDVFDGAQGTKIDTEDISGGLRHVWTLDDGSRFLWFRLDSLEAFSNFYTYPAEIVASNDHTLPQTSTWVRNYPNPFNPCTTIEFNLPTAGTTQVTVVNIRGQNVKTLVNESLSIGTHQVEWNGTDMRGQAVASGIYFAIGKTKAGKYTFVKKMILLK